MKVLTNLFLIVLLPIIGLCSEKKLYCLINEELENDIPAKKKIFISKEIELYFDKTEGWLYEKKKKEWELLNQEKRNLMSKSLIENIGNFIFIKKIYNTEKKNHLQSIDKIILFKQKLEMIFIKEYYNNHTKFFSSEIRGICK
jgi:hypothetical protein